jgi:hypothetical protein
MTQRLQQTNSFFKKMQGSKLALTSVQKKKKKLVGNELYLRYLPRQCEQHRQTERQRDPNEQRLAFFGNTTQPDPNLFVPIPSFNWVKCLLARIKIINL